MAACINYSSPEFKALEKALGSRFEAVRDVLENDDKIRTVDEVKDKIEKLREDSKDILKNSNIDLFMYERMNKLTDRVIKNTSNRLGLTLSEYVNRLQFIHINKSENIAIDNHSELNHYINRKLDLDEEIENVLFQDGKTDYIIQDSYFKFLGVTKEEFQHLSEDRKKELTWVSKIIRSDEPSYLRKEFINNYEGLLDEIEENYRIFELKIKEGQGFLEDYSDQYLKNSIAFFISEGNNIQAEAYQYMLDNPNVRKQSADEEAKIQKADYMSTYNYFKTQEKQYGIPFIYLILKEHLENIYKEEKEKYTDDNGVILSRNKKDENGKNIYKKYKRGKNSANGFFQLDIASLAETHAQYNSNKSPLFSYTTIEEDNNNNLKVDLDDYRQYKVQEVKDGIWVKFEKGNSNHYKPFSDLAKTSKYWGDSWCNASLATASSHLNGGDFYAFIDNQGHVRLGLLYNKDSSDLSMSDPVPRGVDGSQNIRNEDYYILENFLDTKAPAGQKIKDSIKYKKVLLKFNDLKEDDDLSKYNIEDILYIIQDAKSTGHGEDKKLISIKKLLLENKSLKTIIARKYNIKEDDILISLIYTDDYHEYESQLPDEFKKNNYEYVNIDDNTIRINYKVIIGNLIIDLKKDIEFPFLLSGDVSANNATTVNLPLHTTGYVSAYKATTVNLPLHTTGSVSADNATTVNLPLHTTGYVHADNATIVNLPLHTTGYVSANIATTVNLPLHTIGYVHADNATTLNLPLHTIGDVSADKYLRTLQQERKIMQELLINNEITEEEHNSLFLNQDKRGFYVKTKNKEIIGTTFHADITTKFHEIVHSYEKVLTKEEIKIIEDWCKYKKGTTNFSEAFAKGAELFLYEGKSSNKELQSIFDKLLNAIRYAIKNALEYFKDINKLNSDIRNIYEQMLVNDEMEAANNIDYQFKSVDILLSDKDKQVSYKEDNNGTIDSVTAQPINTIKVEDINRNKSSEIIDKFMSRLSSQLKVSYYIITSEQAKEITKDALDQWNGEKGFFYNGKVYIVGDLLQLDTAIHEFAHPLIRAILQSNPELFNAFYRALEKTSEGQQIINDVTKLYPELDTDMLRTSFMEEVLVRALTKSAMSILDNTKDTSGFEKVINDILYAIKQLLRKVFGQRIDISKLDASTTLYELAEKLMKGENFDINLEKISEEDIVAYSKEFNDIVDDLLKLDRPELQSIVTRVFDTASHHLNIIKHNKDYVQLKKLLVDESETKDLEVVSSELAKYANRFDEEVKKIEDDLTYNKTKALELTKSLMRIKNVTDMMVSYLSVIKKEPNNKENLSRAFYFKTLTNYWKSFVVETKDLLHENNTPPNSPLSKIISEIDNNIDKCDKIKEDIDEMASSEILNKELMMVAANIDDYYKNIISGLKKKGASEKHIDVWHKEYHGLTITEMDRMNKLKDSVDNGTADRKIQEEYEFLKRKTFNGAKLTREKIQKTIKGQLGDARYASSFFEGYMYNSDPVVGGLALYIKNHMTDVMNIAQGKYNTFANDIKDLLEEANYNPSNIGELAKFITHVQSIGKYKDGEFIEQKVHSFLSPHKDYRYEIDKLRDDIDKAENAYRKDGLTANIDKWRDARMALKKFNRDYMHQEFIPDFYKHEDRLERDDIGKKASDKRMLILSKINAIHAQAINKISELELSNQLEIYWQEYKQLHSRYDEYGNLKKDFTIDTSTGNKVYTYDLSIAERLQEYKKEAMEYYEWEENEQSFQNSYNEYYIELTNKYPHLSDEDKEKEMSLWLNKNTRIIVDESFYKDRASIIERIQNILSKLPQEEKFKIKLDELYAKRTQLLSPYKDEDGQPSGTDMSEALLTQIKEVEYEILEANKDIVKAGGLTPNEADELSSLFDKGRDVTPSDRVRRRELIDKKLLKLSIGQKRVLYDLYEELGNMQSKEATNDYINIINSWLNKLDTEVLENNYNLKQIDVNTADILLDEDLVRHLLSQSQEFNKWYLNNHIKKHRYDKGLNTFVNTWERTSAWTIAKPTSEDYLQKTTMTDFKGESKSITRKPSFKYYSRKVKDKYRTDKSLIGITKDNANRWLPRLDALNKRFVNEEYFRLKDAYENNPSSMDAKHFAILKKMTEFHLSNQEGLSRNSDKLYLDIPRYRKTMLEVFQSTGTKRALKSTVTGELPFITQLIHQIRDFFRKAKDNQYSDYNWSDDFKLVRVDMYDDSVAKIPISGLSDIEFDTVSLDLTLGLSRYMLSIEKNKKLIEINPVAQAIKSVVEKNKIDETDKLDRFMYNTRNLIRFKKKKDKNIRAYTIKNLIEREFEGVNTTGFGKDSAFIPISRLLFKRASFSFFAFNIPSALKNSLGAKWQGQLEAVYGKYMNTSDFAKGELWAFNTMGDYSFGNLSEKKGAGIYDRGSKTLGIQTVEIFDAIQGHQEEKFGEGLSRTFGRDVASFSWFYNFRKWTENQASLQIFAGLMNHHKVSQYGKEITYLDSWEVIDGQIQLKDGIDKRYHNKKTIHNVGATDTLQSIADKYYIPLSDVEQIVSKEQLDKLRKGIGNTIEIDNAMFKMMYNRMHQISNNLQGTYSKFDQPEAQRYIAFRFVSFLRRYFTSMAINRWGHEGRLGNAHGRLNVGLGDIHEGFYITFLKTLYRTVTVDKAYILSMTREEKTAWLKTISDTIALLLINVAILPFLGWDSNDPDRYAKLRKASGPLPFPFNGERYNEFNTSEWLNTHLIALLMNVRGENEQFNPLPGFGMDDYFKLTDIKSIVVGPTLDSYRKLIEDILRDSDNKYASYQVDQGPYSWQQKGGSKLTAHAMKLFGFTGSTIEPIINIKSAQFNVKH